MSAVMSALINSRQSLHNQRGCFSKFWALRLDRESLNGRDELAELEVLNELVQMEPGSSPDLAPLIARARGVLARAVSDAGEFASMARAAARTGFAAGF